MRRVLARLLVTVILGLVGYEVEEDPDVGLADGTQTTALNVE